MSQMDLNVNLLPQSALSLCQIKSNNQDNVTVANQLSRYLADISDDDALPSNDLLENALLETKQKQV